MVGQLGKTNIMSGKFSMIDGKLGYSLSNSNYDLGIQKMHGSFRGGTPYMMENKVDPTNLNHLKRVQDPKAIELQTQQHELHST